MPKSSTLMRPSLVRKTFSGLMSRWTMPRACAAPSASPIAATISTAAAGSSRPFAGSGGDALAQRFPFEQLATRCSGEPSIVADVVHGHDVGMVEHPHREGLALHPHPSLPVVGEVGRQHLDGHVAPQPRVPGAVDAAHSALADQSGDHVGADGGPGSRCIRVAGIGLDEHVHVAVEQTLQLVRQFRVAVAKTAHQRGPFLGRMLDGGVEQRLELRPALAFR